MKDRFKEFLRTLQFIVESPEDVTRENYEKLLGVYGIYLTDLGVDTAVQVDGSGKVQASVTVYLYRLERVIGGVIEEELVIIENLAQDNAPDKESFIWSELGPGVHALFEKEQAYIAAIVRQEKINVGRKISCIAHLERGKKHHHPGAPCICWQGGNWTLADLYRVPI